MLRPDDVIEGPTQRYRIRDIIGGGGFGIVYHATRIADGIDVAIKESKDARDTELFLREYETLRSIEHGNLPRYYDAFSHGRSGYLVMQYLAGQNLAELIERRGALSDAQVIGFALQLCAALEYLHTRQPPIYHRDVKPANVRLTADGECCLVDFGLMKHGDGLTGASRLGGTYAYAPIEQMRPGTGRSDARTDVYGLAALLYTLATGQAPAYSAEAREGRTPDPLPTVRQLRPDVSATLSEAIRRGMAVASDDRPANVAEFRRLLLAGNADRAAPRARPLTRIVLAAVTIVVLLVSAATIALTSRAALTGDGAALDATVTPLAPTPRLDGTRLPTAAPATLSTATPVPFPTVAPAPTAIVLAPTAAPAVALATPTAAAPAPAAQPSAAQLATDAAGEWIDIPAGGGLAAFRIMRTEVTNAQYAACVAAGACEVPYVQPFPAGGEEERRKYFEVRWNDPVYADHPVLWVTREQARVYAAWRGAMLPSAAQWLRACRGDDGRSFPWGNAAASPELSNYWDPARDPTPDDKDHGDTLPVGSLPAGASPFGVLDMSGNVWEWVDDGTNQVRGGSFYNEANTVRCDSTGQPLQRLNLVGFRLVRASQ